MSYQLPGVRYQVSGMGYEEESFSFSLFTIHFSPLPTHDCPLTTHAPSQPCQELSVYVINDLCQVARLFKYFKLAVCPRTLVKDL
jgi:hypothetical protein